MLNRLISFLDKEEVRHFKIYSLRTQAGGVRKDLQLFDLVRKAGESEDDEELFQEVYPEGKKNAYYRLRNRLAQDIGRSLMVQHFHRDEELHGYQLLALSRLFFQRNAFDLSLHYLRKAEKVLQRQESFELLDVVYGEYIRLSHELLSLNPEEWVQKRRENREELQQLREIDDLLAIVSHHLRISQTLSGKNENILQLLEDLVNRYSSKVTRQSVKLRVKLFQAVSKTLLQRQEYQPLNEYVLDTYETFLADGLFTRSRHDLKLQMMTYIVNSLYKLERMEESLEWADRLHSAMQEHDRLHYDKYYFYYNNARVINYSRSNPAAAIELLQELQQDEAIRKFPFHRVFILLNLGLLYFTQKRYSPAFRHLNRLMLLDEWHTMEPPVRLKVQVVECIIRYELGDYEVLRRRLQQVARAEEELLQQPEVAREQAFLQLLSLMNEADRLRHDEGVQIAAKEFFAQYPREQAQEELIDLHAWLEEKLP